MTRRTIALGLALALMGWLLPARAASLPSEWRRRVGLSLVDVAIDGSGLTVATGEIQMDEEHRAFLVAAFDAGGAELWQDTWLPLPDEPSGTSGEAVTIGADGNVYSVGFGWHCRFGCESGGWFIRSYTRDGTLRWTRQAAGWKTRSRQSAATGIDTWPGGVVVTGYEYDDYAGPTDSWVRVYDLDGSFARKTWVRVAAGTEVHVASQDIAVGTTGAVYVAGYVELGEVEAPGLSDQEPFVAGVGPAGGRRWTRVIREQGDRDEDTAISIDARGGTLVVGGIFGAPIGYGIDPPHLGWLAHLSFDGELRWMRSWGTSRPQSVEHAALTPSGTIATVGGVWIPGVRSYALILRTYTEQGELIGSRTFAPKEGSLVGTSVAFDLAGVSLVGTRYRNAYLWPGIGGRLWRLDGTGDTS